MPEKPLILITQFDIASYLGRHVQTIYERGRRGGLPPYDLKTPTGGGGWFPGTIDAWDKEMRVYKRKKASHTSES
jgi:hypothetical protein|nr:MAG TPA: helix-turn-helix domain protein [Caudoviricetes sp.]